ncbi:MAG: PQQ-binding-like beta-propeller repeat protein [Actinomycetota bacterium]
MNRPIAALLAAVFAVVGLVAFVAGRGETCGDVVGRTDSRLRAVELDTVVGLPEPGPGSGLSELRWVLAPQEGGVGGVVADVGDWTAYLDDDGSVTWTRRVSGARAVPLDRDHLGVLEWVGDRLHLAVLDGEGILVRCDELFATNADVAADRTGGYLTAGAPSDDGATVDLARRIEGDGTERWSSELPGPAPATVPEVVLGGGVAVVGQTDPDRGVILTVFDDVDGSLRWERAGDDELARVRTLLGVAEELLVLTADDGDGERRLLALDLETGDVRWVLESLAADLSGGGVRTDGATVMIEAPLRTLAVDASNGAVRWTASTGGLDLGGSDAEGTALRVDDRLVLVGRSGLVVDPTTGASIGLFVDDDVAIVESASLSDGLLVTDVVVVGEPTDEIRSLIAGWSFDAASARPRAGGTPR